MPSRQANKHLNHVVCNQLIRSLDPGYFPEFSKMNKMCHADGFVEGWRSEISSQIGLDE
jgi:hypothetical protein